MSSQFSPAQQDSSLTLYEGQEELSPQEWEERYINVWLLLEVTEEDEAGEPLKTKLAAITTDPMVETFQHLWRSYADRGIVTLFTHGKYSEPQPSVVAHAS
jgi:hypothetical protein